MPTKFLCLLLVINLSGCSFFFSQGPPKVHASLAEFECSTRYLAPGIDTGIGGLMLMPAVAFAVMSDDEYLNKYAKDEPNPKASGKYGTAAVSMAMAAAFGAAAFYGFRAANSCGRAQEALAERSRNSLTLALRGSEWLAERSMAVGIQRPTGQILTRNFTGDVVLLGVRAVEHPRTDVRLYSPDEVFGVLTVELANATSSAIRVDPAQILAYQSNGSPVRVYVEFGGNLFLLPQAVDRNDLPAPILYTGQRLPFRVLIIWRKAAAPSRLVLKYGAGPASDFDLPAPDAPKATSAGPQSSPDAAHGRSHGTVERSKAALL